jgi:elongation factor 3
LNTLLKSGASKDGPPPAQRNVEAETTAVSSSILTLLPSGLVIVSASLPNGPHTPRHPLLTASINFASTLAADLIYAHRFSDVKQWYRCVGVYFNPWIQGGQEAGEAFAERVRQHFYTIDKAKYAPVNAGDDEEGEILCDTQFSLAYGALLLLSHTNLRLIRGHRYGILGTNGSGKSTLMRQLRDGKVENFPPQSELRCVMVEHSLQGEDTSLSIIDFIASGEFLLTIH